MSCVGTEEVAAKANDKFDGWKVFKDNGQSFGVLGVESMGLGIGSIFDFLKFWRAQTGGQIKLGIEVLRGPSAFNYAVEHSYRLYQKLIPGIHIVVLRLDADDLQDPEYEAGAQIPAISDAGQQDAVSRVGLLPTATVPLAPTHASNQGHLLCELDEAAQRVGEAHLVDRAAVDLKQAWATDEVARHCAREMATFRRLRESRNSSPRGFGALELAIE